MKENSELLELYFRWFVDNNDMKNYILCLLIFISLFGFIKKSYAETKLPSYLEENVHLTKEGSPYLSSGTYIAPGFRVTIDPGVTLIFDNGWLFLDQSDLYIGSSTSSDEVIMKLKEGALRWSGLYVDGGYTEINRLNLKGSQQSLFLNNAQGFISSSTLSGNQRALFYDGQASSTFFGRGNIFSNNVINIYNNNQSTVLDFSHNDWGTGGAPAVGSVVGKVLTGFEEAKPCCSNVMFIPGFEGTRLNKGDNQLWEPNTNADVDKLHLDENGLPLDPMVTVGESIKRSNVGFGTWDKSIYQSFFEDLDQMVSDNVINHWIDFPYDWRLNLPIDELSQFVENLASDSKTGKVTLVGHSNGGLMIKKLMLELRQSGKEDLVDKIIFVAVPQIGAPDAIGAILNGEGQQLGPFDLYLNKNTAQAFGQNLIGAYNLLPSDAYFEKALYPLMSYSGNKLGSFGELSDFTTSTSSPSILRDNLLSMTSQNHADLDVWQPAYSTKVYQIAGTNMPTTRTAEYYSTNHKIIKDREGDGVVPMTSSLFMDAPSYFFDITKYAKVNQENYMHSNIMEAEPIRTTIQNLITNSEDIPMYISTTTPQISSSFELRSYSVHSPISLNIYDKGGNHTGLVKNPDPDSDIMFVKNNIPGSVYEEVGEGKYVSMVEDAPVTVTMQGTGVGTFTFKIEDSYKDKPLKSMVYGDIPVNEYTRVTLDTSGTTQYQLMLDEDGDGKIDAIIKPNKETDPHLYIEVFKKFLENLNIPAPIKKQLLKKINSVIEKKDKKKIVNLYLIIKKFAQQLNNKKFKVEMVSNLINSI